MLERWMLWSGTVEGSGGAAPPNETTGVEGSGETPAVEPGEVAGEETVTTGTEPAEESGEAERSGAPPASPAAPKAPWQERQVAKARQQVVELKRQIAEMQKAVPPPAVAPDTAAQVRAAAQELRSQEKFVEQCVAVHAKGIELFGQEFDTGVKQLSSLVDMSDPKDAAVYNQFLATALKTGQAEVLLHSLAKDPETAERLMGLAPVDQAMEMMKMAAGTAKPAGSKSPKPIVPVAGRVNPAASVAPDDKDRAETLTTSEWMARRNAQVAEARKAGRRIQ